MNQPISYEKDKQSISPVSGTPLTTNGSGRRRSLKGVYEYYIGKREGLDVWIVSGSFIRRKILIGFLFGGNDRVYNFIPDGEIWIDGSINVVELEYTIYHEITERKLMAEKGLSYDEAHILAHREEQQLREKARAMIEEKEKETPRVPFSISESLKLSSGNPFE